MICVFIDLIVNQEFLGLVQPCAIIQLFFSCGDAYWHKENLGGWGQTTDSLYCLVTNMLFELWCFLLARLHIELCSCVLLYNESLSWI